MSVSSCGRTRRRITEPWRGGWDNCGAPASSGWRWLLKWSRGPSRVNVKVDKTLAASVVLHVLVIGWGLVSFSSRAFVMPEEDSIPVDMISADQLAKVTAGMESGKKENPQYLGEKVAGTKPIEG